MDKCVFCAIINDEVSSYKVLESEHALAVLDVFPASVGHVLVLAKSHHQFFSVTPGVILADMVQLGQQVAQLLQQKFPNIQGINVLMNEQEIAYQTIFHTHMHIIPKYQSNDGLVLQLNPPLKHDLAALHKQLID